MAPVSCLYSSASPLFAPVVFVVYNFVVIVVKVHPASALAEGGDGAPTGRRSPSHSREPMVGVDASSLRGERDALS